jgi:FMN reductase
MALRIIGLGGSLASASKSRAALQQALEGASATGAETRLLDLRELALPMYNPDHDEPNEAAAELIETCYAADGLLGRPFRQARPRDRAGQRRVMARA